MFNCLAVAFLCFLALNIVSIVRERRQGHYKPVPVQPKRPAPIIKKLETPTISHQELIKEYPILLTFIKNGYIIETVDPLVMSHKDSANG